MSDIVIRGLSKCYDGKSVLSGFDFTFAEGGVYCITGPSGCGKTTLLRLIAGLEKPDEGTVAGVKSVAMVFQEDRLAGHLSAEANISMVCRDKSSIKKALEEIGLDDARNRAVKDYSGGMARRVAIVRALLSEGEVLLLDEPFKGLDSENLKAAAQFIAKNRRGRTLLLVTHSESEAALFGIGAQVTSGLAVAKLDAVDNPKVR